MDFFSLEIVNGFGENPCNFLYNPGDHIDMRGNNWYVCLNGFSRNYDFKRNSGGLVIVDFIENNIINNEVHSYLRYLDLSQKEINFTERHLLYMKCYSFVVKQIRIKITDANGRAIGRKNSQSTDQSIFKITFLNAGPIVSDQEDSDTDTDSD